MMEGSQTTNLDQGFKEQINKKRSEVLKISKVGYNKTRFD